MNNRHLIFAHDNDAAHWLVSRWFEFETYPIAAYVFGINEYGADRLDRMLNARGKRFIIVNIKSVTRCRKIFINDSDALAKYDQFIYLTRPLPATSSLCVSDNESVINQLLDKILFFDLVADPLTYDEQHFMRSFAFETSPNFKDS